MAATGTDTARARPSWIPDVHFSSMFGLGRHITAAAFSGLATGLVVGGVGGRIFMRLAGATAGSSAQGRTTEAGFTVGEVTVFGTIALVIFIGIFVGIAGTAFYLAFQPWLSWAGRWRGVVFGVALFSVGSATSDMMNPDNFDFFILGNAGLLVGLIFMLFVAFGVVLDAGFRFLSGRFPGPEEGGGIGVVYAVISAIGLVMIVPLTIGLLSPESLCDCEPPYAAIGGLLIAALGTIGLWIAAVFGSSPSWLRTLASIVGYTGTAAAVAFGLIRAISDAIEIIT